MLEVLVILIISAVAVFGVMFLAMIGWFKKKDLEQRRRSGPGPELQ